MDYDCAESPVVTVCYHDVTDLLSLSVTVMFISPVHVFIATDRWCRCNGFFFLFIIIIGLISYSSLAMSQRF